MWTETVAPGSSTSATRGVSADGSESPKSADSATAASSSPATAHLEGTSCQKHPVRNTRDPTSEMATPTASHLDDLALQTRIDDYGDFSIVTIPGCEHLTPPERWEITLKAQQLQAANSLDPVRLCAALRDVTPPLNEQEELEDSRRKEAQARRDLESDGCSPCYPPDVDVSELRNPPKECRAIVNYWSSFPWTGGNLLCAQLIEWRKFRASQQRARRRFKDFEQELRQRRQRHGLNGPPALTMELEQQSPLQRWIEFQNHALMRLEGMERKRDGLRKELTEPHIADDMDAYRYMLELSEKDIKRHMVLLRWIEQKRQAMNSRGDARASGKAHSPIVRRASGRTYGKKKAVLSPILDNRARISKPNGSLKLKTRHQMAKPETATTRTSDIIPPEATGQGKRRLPIAKGSNQIGSAKDSSVFFSTRFAEAH